MVHHFITVHSPFSYPASLYYSYGTLYAVYDQQQTAQLYVKQEPWKKLRNYARSNSVEMFNNCNVYTIKNLCVTVIRCKYIANIEQQKLLNQATHTN